MTLTVHAMGAYASYSREDIDWRQTDYNIHKLVKSLKGEHFRGYADMRDIDRSWKQITGENNAAAYTLFANWAQQRLMSLNLGSFILVPVPSSSCITYDAVTTPSRMAHSIQRRLGATSSVGHWLKFREVMQQSHAGGTRDPVLIGQKLWVSPHATAAHIILIDDVKTTGGHLKACANKFREIGATVEHAIVAASTVWEQHPTPLDVAPEDIEMIFNIDDFL